LFRNVSEDGAQQHFNDAIERRRTRPITHQQTTQLNVDQSRQQLVKEPSLTIETVRFVFFFLNLARQFQKILFRFFFRVEETRPNFFFVFCLRL
jgi:hypothetical protein